MTIEIQRHKGTFLYRQREEEPLGPGGVATHVIESRPTYRGGRWSFIARFASADEARAALLMIGTVAKSDLERDGKASREPTGRLRGVPGYPES